MLVLILFNLLIVRKERELELLNAISLLKHGQIDSLYFGRFLVVGVLVDASHVLGWPLGRFFERLGALAFNWPGREGRISGRLVHARALVPLFVLLYHQLVFIHLLKHRASLIFLVYVEIALVSLFSRIIR